MVEQKKDIYSKFLIINENDINDWNEMITQLNNQYREVLVLKKN